MKTSRICRAKSLRRHIGIACRHIGIAREHIRIALKYRIIVRNDLRQRRTACSCVRTRSAASCKAPMASASGPMASKRKPPLGGHAVEKRLLRESAHDEHPFHGPAASAQPQSAVGLFAYRHHFEVKLRRRPGIDAQLVEAGLVALLQRREVEKRVFHRPFHLVRERPGQKHVGSMRLDTLNGCRRGNVRFALHHVFQHLGLSQIGLPCLVNHAVTIPCPAGHRVIENTKETRSATCRQ